MIAVAIREPAVVKLLISAGASQRGRDKQDKNIIHLLLEKQNLKTSELREMLSCLNPDAVKQMMLERCKVAPTALTPLALWLSQIHDNLYHSFHPQIDQPKHEILKVLMEYSSGQELEMLNGEGDLPLHFAVRKGFAAIASHILSLRPDLLYRENATGRTPLEMASDLHLRDMITPSPQTQNQRQNRHWQHQSIVNKPDSEFLPDSPYKEVRGVKETYEVCVAADEAFRKSGGVVRRRLVSLNEANEVARRLAVAKGETRKRKRDVGGGDGDMAFVDEVEEWMKWKV